MSGTNQEIIKTIHIKSKSGGLESLKTNPKRLTHTQSVCLNTSAVLAMSLSLEEMNRPTHRQIKDDLIKFAEDKRSDENVKFIFNFIDLERALKEESKKGVPLEIIEKEKSFQEKYKILYTTYIPVTAPMSLNLSASARGALITQSGSFFTLECFRAAYDEINALINPEVLKPFHSKRASEGLGKQHSELYATSKPASKLMLYSLDTNENVERRSRTPTPHAPSSRPSGMTTQMAIKETARAEPDGAPTVLPLAAKGVPQFNFQILSDLLRLLKSYLSIVKKKKEEEKSLCFCFTKHCKPKNQPFHSSLRALKNNLVIALEHWHNHYLVTLENEITTIFKSHQRDFKKGNEELMESLNAALSMLQNEKNKKKTTLK